MHVTFYAALYCIMCPPMSPMNEDRRSTFPPALTSDLVLSIRSVVSQNGRFVNPWRSPRRPALPRVVSPPLGPVGPHAARPRAIDVRRSRANLHAGRHASRSPSQGPVGPHAAQTSVVRRLTSRWRPRTIRWSRDDNGRMIERGSKLSRAGSNPFFTGRAGGASSRNFDSKRDEYQRIMTKLAFPAVAISSAPSNVHARRGDGLGSRKSFGRSGDSFSLVADGGRIRKAKASADSAIVVTPFLEEDIFARPG